MSPLTHKLLRDLWRMKGQAVAIGLVIAMGVALQVMMSGLVTTLEGTRDAYYQRYRLAEVFAPVTRAPSHVEHQLAAIPGVARAEGRVVGAALVDLPGRAAPVPAQALSLPRDGAAHLNAVFLSSGHLPDPAHSEEILLVESFAKAHGLRTGDRITATLNGTRRMLRITGFAQAPEYLYLAAPGEMVPDDARFAVIWMDRDAISALYDMKGAFNEAILSLERGATLDAVLHDVDTILDPYGGRGAYGRKDQFSNQFVSEEIGGLKDTARSIPPLFLLVAAFLLYIVVGRMVQAEREEIGLLKAFGYTDFEVGAHYFKLILVIALSGAAFGCLVGIGGGRFMVQVYLLFFKFPFLIFRLDPASFATGVSVSIAAASAGGLLVLRRVFALAPAVAMRPPVPPDYSRSARFGAGLATWLDQPSRMVLRRITRQPLRLGGAMIGIACGMALCAAMLSTFTAFNKTIGDTFSVIDRSDLTVSFTGAVSERAVYALSRREGVIRAEPVRHVPAIFRNGRATHRGAITGLRPGATLARAIDRQYRSVPIRSDGVVLNGALARKLDLKPGDLLQVEIREGRRPVLHLPVVSISESYVGMPVFMDLDALNRALHEPGRVNGAYVDTDPARQDALTNWLKTLPSVIGVSIKSEAEAAMRKVMNQGAGSSRFIMGFLAFVITYGIVYNTARIAHAERARDLASLRVIGFSRAEAAFVLLGELGVITLLALPVGAVLGYWLLGIITAAYSTDLYSLPATFEPTAYGSAALVVVSAALVSGLLVKRDLDETDLVGALKTRE